MATDSGPAISPERQSIITDPLRKGYVAFNGGASIVELAAGIITGNVAQAVDGMHGTGEIVITNTQMKDAHETDHVDDKHRRNIYIALSAFSLAGCGVATGDLAGWWHFGSDSLGVEATGLAATTVSLGSCVVATRVLVKNIRGKYSSFWGSWRRKEIDSTDVDVVKHVALKDTPSAALAFLAGAARVAGEISSAKGSGTSWLRDAEYVIGIAEGAWGAYLFRPTRQNLEHQAEVQGRETVSKPMEQLMQIGKQE